LSIIRDLKRRTSVPIIMLTATASAIDRVVGLELGADDYLAKPCELRELLARIRSVLRRSSAVQPAAQPAAGAPPAPASAPGRVGNHHPPPPRERDRAGGRPRARRGRLSRQAVRAARALGPHPLGAAPEQRGPTGGATRGGCADGARQRPGAVWNQVARPRRPSAAR